MASLVGQFILDKEAQAEIEKMEQLKRIGHSFIRVVYTGRNQVPRYHGFHNVGIVNEYDPDQAKDIPRAVLEDRAVEFQRGSDGRLTTDILDDEHNRMAISRHLGMDMEVDDPNLAKEIAALTNKPYMVEPDRKTQLLREKQRIEGELSAMGVNTIRRRGRKPTIKSMVIDKEEPVGTQAAGGESSG